MFRDKIIFISGGTGSWGQALCKRLLLEDPQEIRIFSRNELSQVQMQRDLNDIKIKYIIGDVRDINSLNNAMRDVDYVFHLAALKHVPICEAQPREAILTNIIGTENIIQAAINNNVEKVIDVSTDKAVAPYNLYGMTKAVGEKLIINANTLTKKTKFVCIRGGNVIGTNGSVIPFFINQLNKNNEVTITSKEMTRYFISLDEAIELLIKASKLGFGGETIVMNMPACKIIDLVKVLIDEYGNKNTKIKEIGIRPGEKIHEELISMQEMPYSYFLSENYFLIKPTISIKGLEEHYHTLNNYRKLDMTTFDSSQKLMNYEQIKQKLMQSGFIKISNNL